MNRLTDEMVQEWYINLCEMLQICRIPERTCPNGMNWLPPVLTVWHLPSMASTGDAVMVLDTQEIYVYNINRWLLICS